MAENIATVRAFYSAGPSDDDADRYPFAAPEIVWHVPGDNPMSRDYVGVHDVFETMGAAMRPLDLVARRGPHHVACTGGHVFRFDRGRIVEAWGFVRDQAALDDLFRHVPAP